jgi:hypothetical protein
MEKNVMKLPLLAALGVALGMLDPASGGASGATTDEDIANLT